VLPRRPAASRSSACRAFNARRSAIVPGCTCSTGTTRFDARDLASSVAVLPCRNATRPRLTSTVPASQSTEEYLRPRTSDLLSPLRLSRHAAAIGSSSAWSGTSADGRAATASPGSGRPCCAGVPSRPAPGWTRPPRGRPRSRRSAATPPACIVRFLFDQIDQIAAYQHHPRAVAWETRARDALFEYACDAGADPDPLPQPGQPHPFAEDGICGCWPEGWQPNLGQ
jgi:hypothetical protein